MAAAMAAAAARTAWGASGDADHRFVGRRAGARGPRARRDADRVDRRQRRRRGGDGARSTRRRSADAARSRSTTTRTSTTAPGGRCWSCATASATGSSGRRRSSRSGATQRSRRAAAQRPRARHGVAPLRAARSPTSPSELGGGQDGRPRRVPVRRAAHAAAAPVGRRRRRATSSPSCRSARAPSTCRRAWRPRWSTRCTSGASRPLGIWSQVPHYVATMSYPAASVALLEGLATATGVARRRRRPAPRGGAPARAPRSARRRQRGAPGDDRPVRAALRRRRARTPRRPRRCPATAGSSCAAATRSPARSSASCATRARAETDRRRRLVSALRAHGRRTRTMVVSGSKGAEPLRSARCRWETSASMLVSGGPRGRSSSGSSTFAAMKVDGGIPNTIAKAGAQAAELEKTGYSGGWTAETSHDPFLPLLLGRRAHRHDRARHVDRRGLRPQPDDAGQHGVGPAGVLARAGSSSVSAARSSRTSRSASRWRGATRRRACAR